MRLKFGKHTNPKQISRLKKKIRVRKTVQGTGERPRLNVYRSLKHVYAQIIDDASGNVLVSASTLKNTVAGKKGKEAAAEVGKMVAEKAQSKNISQVVFDRNGYLYHGQVKALADSAREAGLKF